MTEGLYPIPGIPNHCIKLDGTVYTDRPTVHYNNSGMRELSQFNRKGYLAVKVIINGKRVGYNIHKLLAITFELPKLPEHTEIRHLDGNPLNNSLDNLAWGAHEENVQDRAKHGRDRKGEQINTAVLDAEKVAKIKAMWAEGYDTLDIAVEFNVSESSIRNVVEGRTWKHLLESSQ